MNQPTRKRSLWPIVILGLVSALFGFGTGLIIIAAGNRQAGAPAAAQPAPVMRFLRENEPVPDFTLNTLDGRAVSLADFRGQPVLINFWATWCPPCLEETPELAAAYDALKERGVAFIGIGMQDETAKLRQFVDDHRVPYTIVEDPLGKVGGQYRVLGMPTTFIVDKDGLLRKSIQGAVNQDQIMEALSALTQ
jgi:peroxiredoxin